MPDRPIRVLLVDDDEDDFALTRYLLADSKTEGYDLEWAPSYERGLEEAALGGHDVYLLDFRLGPHTGVELLREAQRRGCKGPFLMLTGQGQRELDLEAMQAGAADFLEKGQLTGALLERSIRYAMERRKHADELERRVNERTSELAKANQRLRETDRRKTEFLAMLAHELRNPLAPIRNALYFVRLHQREAQPEAVRDAYAMMERQLEHLIRLVDDLLDVSRITRGRITLQTEVLDLAGVVARAVECARPLIDGRGHTLEMNLPQGPMAVEGDAVRLVQVVLNLLVNAARYTLPGGTIWLSVEREADPPIAVLKVRDNGIGIPPEMLSRIFELFTQVDRTIERAEGGLGIGLTLSRQLAEMHGGTVVATSEGLGKGSEFVVRLPLSAKPLPPPSLPRKVTATRRRVLVVDDNKDSASSLAKLLTLMGHEVRTANDGRSGLAEIVAHQPDVVVLDLGMPGMTGFEVARHLRAKTAIRQPLLVALTGFGTAEDRRQTREAGFDAHLVKPVDLKALLELLTKAAPGL